MELFQRAKAVRLKSHHEKYLFANEDEVHVIQDKNGASSNARWSVEFVTVAEGSAPEYIRLKSRYGSYLTASNEPFLLGVTGRKVLQTIPERLDSSVEWEPVRDGSHVRLKTRYGHFLRANGSLPPWRNSVTHDIPHRSSSHDLLMWDVEVVQVATPVQSMHGGSAGERMAPQPPRRVVSESPGKADPKMPRSESLDSGPLHKVEGRVIYYATADDAGNVDDGEMEGHSFTFDGTSLEELVQILEEETGLSEIIVCSRNPINNKLCPLRLQLPPNNAAMRIVIVPSTSRLARTLQ